MQVTQVIANLRAQARTLRQAEESVADAIKVLEAAVPEVAPAKKGKGRKGKRKPMSKEARAKIAAAAKARWAEKKEKEGK